MSDLPLPSASSRDMASGAFKIEFIFFMESVEALEARLAQAISGPSLGVFLRGQGEDFFKTDIERNFEEEGGVKTGFWPPLSEATVAIREWLGFPGPEPINRRTDEMYNALLNDPYPLRTGLDFAEMQVPGNLSGEVLKKFETAQIGSNSNPWGYGPTPPRPVLAVSELDAQTLMELYQVFFIAEMMGEELV